MKRWFFVAPCALAAMFVAPQAQAQTFAPQVCPATIGAQAITNPLQILATTAVPSAANTSTAWSFRANGFYGSPTGSFSSTFPDQAPWAMAGTIYFSTGTITGNGVLTTSATVGKFVYVATSSQYGVINRETNFGKFTVNADCTSGQLTFLSGTNTVSFDFFTKDGTFKTLELVATTGQGQKGATITGEATRY